MEEMMCYIPENLEEALAIMDEKDAIALAGGSDLMVSGANGTGVNPSFSRPVVIISNLSELKGIKKREDGWTEIGAAGKRHCISFIHNGQGFFEILRNIAHHFFHSSSPFFAASAIESTIKS